MRGLQGRKELANEGPVAVTAGGFRTITEVHNFAKRRLRRTASDHSQSTFWYEMGHNSEKLLGFGALFFASGSGSGHGDPAIG